MWIDAPNQSNRTLAEVTLGFGITETEIPPQSLWKHTGGQGHVGFWNTKPCLTRSENLYCYPSCGGADGQNVGLVHCLHIRVQASVTGGQQVLWYPKHACEELAFGVQARSFCRTERPQDEVMCDQSTLAQGGVDPPQRRNVVGAIWRSCLERTNAFQQHPRNGRGSMMQRSSGSKCLIDGAEDHRKHHFECAVKARDRVCQRPGMVGNG